MSRHGGVWYWVAPWRTRGVPDAPSQVPWCTKVRVAVQGGSISVDRKTGAFTPSVIRCPDCGRRVKLMAVDIEQGYGDFWPYIPPHKVRTTKVKADQSKVRRGRLAKRHRDRRARRV